ncbi:MAG: hypothetical protein GY822_28545 [Deltaproteobacteria bacterium]|nr:hypothetical protein [Deltaproteobacteria bacterium]
MNQIAAGGKNLCILDDNGHPSCLSGPLQTYLKSRNRSRALPSLVGLSVGPTFACGLHKKSKHVFCFGERALDLPLPAGPMKQVSVGGLHACAVDVKGALSCFGLRDVFQQVKNAPSGNFVEVAAGQSHSCALDDEGAVHCWGANTRGQCMP